MISVEQLLQRTVGSQFPTLKSWLSDDQNSSHTYKRLKQTFEENGSQTERFCSVKVLQGSGIHENGKTGPQTSFWRSCSVPRRHLSTSTLQNISRCL